MMSTENYTSDYWALIYDQYHRGQSAELPFYRSELAGCTGPILELACGTGLLLLPLLKSGLDIHGLDLSPQMLDVLYRKAEQHGIADIRKRITEQNMIDFESSKHLDAAFIAARSFLHLAHQDDQIACLRNINAHLKPGGRLLLNFFTPRLDLLVRYTASDPEFVDRGQYKHPETGEPISLSVRQVNDIDKQIQNLTWRFRVGSETHDVPMTVRWVYRTEFELLAKLTGFRIAALYSGFGREPYKGEGEMVWVLEKAPDQAQALTA